MFLTKIKTLRKDNQIQAWNPENQSMDPRKVGKNIHLENLRKCLHVCFHLCKYLFVRSLLGGKKNVFELLLL